MSQNFTDIDRSSEDYTGLPYEDLNFNSTSYEIDDSTFDKGLKAERELLYSLANIDMEQRQAQEMSSDKPWERRWTKLIPHGTQNAACISNKRFNVIPAGRRSGKTELIGKRKMILRFLNCRFPKSPFYSPYPDPRYFIGAPTRDQAKRIYWSDLKAMIPRSFLAKPPNESSLMLKGKNGAVLYLMGLDKPERIEGSPWDWGLVDEIGNVKQGAWPENIRPALSDRRGGCDFIGVPEGRNHYWKLYDRALKSMEKYGEKSDWGAFHWISADILPPEEILAAKEDLDPLVYKQEYEASFVNFSGMAYYNFNRSAMVGNYRQFYNPKRPLVFCFDFNVAPGVAVVCQELGADVFKVAPGTTVTVALGEVYINAKSNTVMVCNRLIESWEDHPGNVICYGDSTGGAKGSAKVRGSDWDLIKETLTPVFGDRLYFNVPKTNPRERQRVNAVNSRLMSASGLVRFLIDGKYCPHLVDDLEGVRVLEGSAGELDKKTDLNLTHISDAAGYYIAYEYPVFKYFTAEDIKNKMRKYQNQKELRRQYGT
jgi:hypothetical protein